MSVRALCGLDSRRQPLWLALLWAAATSLVLPGPARAQQLPDFTELVERVGPAVVNIRTLERSRRRGRPGAAAP